MAVPKHILRIHDTEANLLASLKDTQIAYATDIDEAIWRNGTDFHYLSSGKAWNGASYDYSNIDATSITIHDGGGNTKVVDYASLLTETFEINQASDFKTALESNINRKTLIMNEKSIYYTGINTIDVYGINVLIGHDVDISTGVGITADFTENVGSPTTQIICRNTTFSLGLAGGLDFDGDIDIDIFARHFDTTITNLDGLGTITYEKTDSTLPVTGTYTIAQSFWDNTAPTAVTQGDGITISGGVVSTRTTQGLQYSSAGELKLGPHYLGMASSGVYSGGVLSVSAPVDANVNIGVCEGFVIDTSVFGIDTIVTTPVSVVSPIVFTPTNIATQNVTYVGLNSSGTQVEWNQPPTPEQRRDNIFLGVAVHSNNSTVEFVNNLQDVSSDITGQVHDLSRYLGYFNIEGNGVTANGVNLSFNKAIGKAFKTGVNFTTNPKDPDTNSLAAKVLSSFRYRTQLGAEGSDVTVIDPTSYDNAGTITAIAGSNNQTTIQRIYIFPSNQIRVQYGQEVYTSFSDGVDAVGKQSFVTDSNISENGLLLCSLVVQKGCTDLSDITCAGFFQAGRFGETGSIGSTAVGTLQSGYNNSLTPEIVTNTTLGALSIKRGSALDTDNVLETQNGAGTNTFEVAGDGQATFSNDILASKSGGIFNIESSGSVQLQIGKSTLDNTIIMNTSLNTTKFYRLADEVMSIGSLIINRLQTIIQNKFGGAVDTDKAFEVRNIAGTTNFSIDGNGLVEGASFNGVPLTDSGVATNYLDETGAYSVPAGGVGDAVLSATQTFTGVNTFSDKINMTGTSAPTSNGISYNASGDFLAWSQGTNRLINSSVIAVSSELNVRNYPFGLSLTNQNLTMTNAPSGISTGTGAYHQIEKKMHESSTSVFSVWFTDTKANRVWYTIVNLNVWTDWKEVGVTNSPRVGTDGSTVTLNIDASIYDQFNVTAQSTALTISAPTNPTEGQSLKVRLKDNGTGRALTWNAIWRVIGTTLPTTTTSSKTIYIEATYNSDDTKWDVLRVNEEV